MASTMTWTIKAMAIRYFTRNWVPREEYASAIQEAVPAWTSEVVDLVGRMLRNVRTPTAQMDFFSVFTQLCADHLMSVNPVGSNPELTAAFDDVRSACSFLQGVAHQLTLSQ